MKENFVCSYAVVRFLPYMETQEFVNIGVVMACPTLRLFDFKIELKRRERVNGFFPELQADIFMQGRRDFARELLRLKKLLSEKPTPQMRLPLADGEFVRIFREVVRTRESIFRFGSIGTVLTHDPAAELTRLFQHFVERQFAQHEDFQETIMARRLAQNFRAKHIMEYKSEKLGDDNYQVSIPFVRHMGDEKTAIRAIKPLDLAKRDPTRIIEHGDRWLARVGHLRKMNYDPAAFLFPVKMPAESKQLRAAEGIREELEATGVKIISFRDTDRIVEFAAVA